MKVRTGFFPSTATVHLRHAVEAGLFADTGLEVGLRPVTSSQEQLALWDAGELTVMHTSPDHLFGPRAAEPVAVRAESLGELVLMASADTVRNASARWAVDAPGSAFALVLRRLLDHLDVAWLPEQLVPVGGTMQRWVALSEGRVDGSVLHTPFRQQSETAGLTRLCGHLEVLPGLCTTAVVVARSQVDSPAVAAYLAALERSRAALLAGGADRVAAALVRAGLSGALAGRVAPDTLAELGAEPVDLASGVQQAADLRAAYVPGWRPERPVGTLVQQR